MVFMYSSTWKKKSHFAFHFLVKKKKKKKNKASRINFFRLLLRQAWFLPGFFVVVCLFLFVCFLFACCWFVCLFVCLFFVFLFFAGGGKKETHTPLHNVNKSGPKRGAKVGPSMAKLKSEFQDRTWNERLVPYWKRLLILFLSCRQN